MRKFYDAVYWVFLTFCKLIFIASICITSYVVFMRFVLSKTPRWGEQAILMCMVYMALISASLAIRTDKHLRVVLIQYAFPAAIRARAMAVSFFILAGELMGEGGISDKLIELSDAIVGWMRGGLAMVNIVASMFFGGISGSSAADCASLGTILIPMMVEQGYDDDFSANVTMTSSVQGILIPPSHNMVIYATVAGSVSIGRLFIAGYAPGILLGIALMIYSFYISVKKQYPKGDAFSLKRFLKSFLSAFWGLMTVLIVVVWAIVIYWPAFTMTLPNIIMPLKAGG